MWFWGCGGQRWIGFVWFGVLGGGGGWLRWWKGDDGACGGWILDIDCLFVFAFCYFLVAVTQNILSKWIFDF